jgi:hypothetical protein
MKKLTVFLFSAILLFAIGCGGKKDDEKIDIYDIDKIVEKGEQMSKEMNAAEAKLEARRKKGDTLAIAWEKLNEIIPDISGFTRSEPQGMNLTFDNASYSNATANFTKDNLSVEVSVYDYNVVVSLFAGVTAWRTLGMSVQSSDGYQKVTKFDEIKDSWMFEEYNKSGKRATVTVGLNDRYWMQVSANEQSSTDFVKQIAIDVARSGKSLFNK